MQNRPQFGALVKEYRLKRGLTQMELASQLGYSNPQFVSLVERDQSKAPLSMLGQLIVVLGIPESEVQELLLNNYRIYVEEELSQGIREAQQRGVR